VVDPPPAELTKAADRFERSSRHLLLALIPIALLAAVDLATGWLTGDRRIAIALLVATAMAVWGAYSLRWLARRFRTGDVARPPTRQSSLFLFASIAASLALSAGFGYLIGGWVLAVLIPSATIVVIAASGVYGIRCGRRLTAGR
jgi:hypothetical protein